ncbi:MAG: GNAT family N-acetyltransferase [Anaerolineales bacterium]
MTALTLLPAAPTLADAEQVLHWRNDPLTRQMSFHQTPKRMPNFFDEFCDIYFVDTRLPPLFGVVGDEKVGFLRFRAYDNALPAGLARACDIGVMIAPEWRGRGYGTQLVTLGTVFIHQQGWPVVVAEIREQNPASEALFAKAGYIYIDDHQRMIHDLPEPVAVKRYVHRGTENE